MKIFLINRFFGNPQVPTGRMLSDLAKELSERGHTVSVLISRDSYEGISETETDACNIEIHSIRLIGPKIVRWPLFWFRAILYGIKISWDCCVILTDPPFLPVLGGLESLFLRKKRYVYWWTMDLYPEALKAAGVINENSLVYQFLKELNELGLRNLNGVITLDVAQKKRLSQYRNWNRQKNTTITVPPWDFRKLDSVPGPINRFIRECGLTGRKIALYAGNIGRAHDHRQLVAAARLSAEQNDEWAFVFVCRGSGRAELELDAAGLSNVFIMDYVRPELTAHLIHSASVHLITMQDQWEGICVPSKLYGILPTGIPVLYIGPLQSGTAQEILHHKAGIVLPSTIEGIDVLRALNQLYELERIAVKIDTSGPQRIAEFITDN